MGFLVVTAVLVVTLGRLGDMYGRVKIYNAGFVVFTLGSIALAFDPLHGPGGAMWLIVWRLVQGVGAAMLFANSTAILTDASRSSGAAWRWASTRSPPSPAPSSASSSAACCREWHWRAVFFVSVPIGIAGTIWSYRRLHELSDRQPAKHRLVGQRVVRASA